MSVEDSKELPFPDAGSKSNDTSQIMPYPTISNSVSLEDGEIVEGRYSSILSESQPLSPQSRDLLQLCSSNPLTQPAASSAPTYEPMTKEDLDRAKSLVLDLLGWGVTPEYLVECGLSPGAVYTIFTDLRLRLPSNLQVSSSSPSHHAVR